ncbi:DNA-binding transcriptional regulator [Saccharobesus litoralis]|uniref:DNA-binding transcriptional regulator n=1 Tax=Saccharobesus litoralis TaxID=2172099 RepID=A0A2S0VSK3_9ALTE|nr:YafY family protein [Saccharobesus litoralis]AWB67195.1 DNA-binding transcriptional regulator [Saccharobesus litoralis]
MRKAERLFQILTILRGRRTVITAQQLADILEVSERTIYRDIQAMSLSGIPIESEAGIGYRLKPDFTVPPLMFTEEEIEALLLGTRMVENLSHKAMAQAASSALSKIHAVLPDKLHRQSVQQPEWLLVFNTQADATAKANQTLSSAIKSQQILHMSYTDEQGRQTERDIWPLGLIYWGKTWTVVAWCTKRDDYRMFRLDRIRQLQPSGKTFQLNADISLQQYIAIETAKHC